MSAAEQGGLPPGLAVSITVIRGPDVGTKYAMTGPKMVLGRKRGEVLLRDREASGIHASIERTPDGRFILRDLGSTNGTFLDGKRVTATELRPGQQLKVGANYLLFTVTAETASDETRLASGEISGQIPLPPPPQEIVFGKTVISAPDHPVPPLRSPFADMPAPVFDADLGEPDLSEHSTDKSPPVSRPASAASAPWQLNEAPIADPFAALSPAPATPPPGGGLPEGVEASIYGVYLLVERGKDRGKVFPVNRQVTVLGRSGTEVLIDDPDISRRHAALDIQGQGKYILRDLASTNGTLLNGVRIQTESIASNDKIRMGSTTIKLIVGDARVATEVARVRSSPTP